MDTGTKTYQIDKHKQLIPLNGTTVNFTCFFEVKSKDKKPFNITIVEQGEIKPKQYKLVDDGYINGQIESDGQLKSYFLVLKAQEPCECDVRIVLKPKEANEPHTIPSTSASAQPSIQPNNIAQLNTPLPQSAPYSNSNTPLPQSAPYPNMPQPNMVLQNKESYFQMKYIIGISLALIIIYLLYRFRKTIFEKFSNDNTLRPSMSNTSF
jgi:hypothetical protein